MLKKSTFEKFAKEMKEKFNDEYILILATDIDCEWELKQMEYDDFDRGCYDDDFYYSDCDDEDSYDKD